MRRAPTSRIIEREHVDGAEHDVDVGRAHRVTAGAREIEQVLDAMCDFLDRGHPERAGVALDRVKRAEDVVEERGVARTVVEREQSGFDRSEMIQRFGQKQIGHFWIVTQECQLVICHDIP